LVGCLRVPPLAADTTHERRASRKRSAARDQAVSTPLLSPLPELGIHPMNKERKRTQGEEQKNH